MNGSWNISSNFVYADNGQFSYHHSKLNCTTDEILCTESQNMLRSPPFDVEKII